jgi:hypothetical protein
MQEKNGTETREKNHFHGSILPKKRSMDKPSTFFFSFFFVLRLTAERVEHTGHNS